MAVKKVVILLLKLLAFVAAVEVEQNNEKNATVDDKEDCTPLFIGKQRHVLIHFSAKKLCQFEHRSFSIELFYFFKRPFANYHSYVV